MQNSEWSIPFGFLLGAIFFALTGHFLRDFHLDQGIATLLAGMLAIAAAGLALRGAKSQAEAAIQAAKLQSLVPIKLDQQRREDLKQSVAASIKAVSHELTYLMRLCKSTALQYEEGERECQAVDPLAFQDYVRSLKVSTHKLLPTDMATLALLDPKIGRRTAILYSKLARYENLIDECMALGSVSVPEHSADLYQMIAAQAEQGRKASIKLWIAVRLWQRKNRPTTYI
ncbi:hypothetical protein [Ferrovibrio sp.]|uniref:hypothetical protein n=1 Tax=Ferrovibrio sp. TaxID=1917215 RepID=UPI00311F2F3B